MSRENAPIVKPDFQLASSLSYPVYLGGVRPLISYKTPRLVSLPSEKTPMHNAIFSKQMQKDATFFI